VHFRLGKKKKWFKKGKGGGRMTKGRRQTKREVLMVRGSNQ
jgi:hypothetical protein